MDEQSAKLFEKIRQQFDSAPYPSTPLEQNPKESHDLLYAHNLVTSHYLRNQEILSTDGKVILDAGCGTGFKSLVLAEANPGAKIVGIDLSKEAVDLAKQRLQFYGFENAEFIVASIEALPALGMEFDYINCDEVLYLLPDIASGLQAMKAALKPDGIIRANLHSATQRVDYFRAQQVFKIMGLMDSNPEEMEIEIARETFGALEDWVNLKVKVWQDPAHRKSVESKEWVLMNYLFQGDKGYTIADIFAALRSANLEFISMVNGRDWEILDLFKDADDLPIFWAMSLPEVSTEQRLQLFELLHPISRLLDFWCGHPDQTNAFTPIADWSEDEWKTAKVRLHPQLKNSKLREELVESIEKHQPFNLSGYLPGQANTAVILESTVAATLLPLWDEPLSIAALMERSRQIQPLNPATLEPRTPTAVLNDVMALVTRLEVFLYVLLEKP
ncbi:MAG: methyltransferase domain-containing protein [Leptolyngbyaceae cyanobacterium CAN_BIN12]|nr:methyltransferase domain-containing protein [Leptolyngbyaceae cyanobacterium CAN_BIN12]